MIHVITYDLHQPGRDYPKIEAAIQRNADSWRHPQGSVWLVDSLLDPQQWYQILHNAGDSNDSYLIMRLQGNWWSQNLDKGTIDWLKSTQRRW